MDRETSTTGFKVGDDVATAEERDSRREVRSLVRGLDVLIAVNESPPATVSRIVSRTRLPKATVVRILNTLKQRGYIAQDPQGNGYRPLPRVRRLASAMMVENPFLSEAKRLLAEFGNITKWPSDLLLAEADAMLIVASNRDTAPIKMDRFEQRRFPLLDSAAGLAYLSALPARERDVVIEAAAAASYDREGAADLAAHAHAQIEVIRQTGYSFRDYQAPIDGTRVVGLPIESGGHPVGALVLIVLRDAVTEQQMEGMLLPALAKQARRIGEQYGLLVPEDGSGDGIQSSDVPRN